MQAAAADQHQPNQNAVVNNAQAAIINPAGPNIIGNVEDTHSMQLAQEEETPQLGVPDVVMDQNLGNEDSKYKDITGQLKRSKRNRGKSPY